MFGTRALTAFLRRFAEKFVSAQEARHKKTTMLTKGDEILLSVKGTETQGTVNGARLIASFAIAGPEVNLTLAEGEITLKPTEYAILGMWATVMGRARQAQYALRLLATPAATATDQLEIAVLETAGRQRVTATLNGARLPAEVGRLTLTPHGVELAPVHPFAPGHPAGQRAGAGLRRPSSPAPRHPQHAICAAPGRRAPRPAVWQVTGTHAEIVRQLVVGAPARARSRSGSARMRGRAGCVHPPRPGPSPPRGRPRLNPPAAPPAVAGRAGRG